MKILGLLYLMVGLALGQTVNGQTAVSGQTATFTVTLKKIPAITAAGKCSAPQDSTGSYQVVAGTSITCTVTLSAAAPAGGATVALSSADPTSITVPASIVIPVGNNFGTFQATATP